MNEEEKFIIVWEQPELAEVERRLYHDDDGYVLFYTCDKPEGKFVIIDAMTYAEGRPDVRVIDGKIARINAGSVISRYYNSADVGFLCEKEDISVITDTDGQYWEVKNYVL